jgi:hypothetical protein
VTDSCSWDESVDGVEAMVQAAGQYVAASDDLRPRVLEAVRVVCGEQSARRFLWRAVLVIALFALYLPDFRHELEERRSPLSGGTEAAGFDVLDSLVPVATTRSGDGDWRMIDAFTKIRRQQAQLLRLEI